MIKIFVVSLKNSNRREAIQAHLDELGIKFEFFDAIDGKIENPIFDHYKGKTFSKKGYHLTKGELGCYASHYLLWKKCVELNENIIVLEDDVIIDKKLFFDILENLHKLTKGFYKLYPGEKTKHCVIDKDTFIHSSIVKYKSITMMTAGYILTPSCAKMLLDNSDEWVEAVDDFMDKEWVHKIPKYGIYPYCISIRDIPSIIGKRKIKNIPILKKIRIEIFRAVQNIRKKLFWLMLTC